MIVVSEIISFSKERSGPSIIYNFEGETASKIGPVNTYSW